MRLLLEVGSSIVSQLDLRELIKTIADRIRQVIDCDGVGMTLYDEESGKLRIYSLDPGFRSEAPAFEGDLLPWEGTPGGQAYRTLQPVLVTRADLERSTSPLVQEIASRGVQSGCVAPLISHGRALGTIDIVRTREAPFTLEDAEIMTQIAGQIAIAIDNSRNFERARAAERELARKLKHQQLTLSITNAVVSHLDLRGLMEVVYSSVREVMDNDFGGLVLYDPESGQLKGFQNDLPSDHPLSQTGIIIPISGTPAGLAYSTGQAVFRDQLDLQEFHADLMRVGYAMGYRSGGAVPLIAQGRKLGVLAFAYKRENALTPEDKELFQLIANQVAIAVDNALAFREIENLKNRLTSEKLYLEDEIRTEHNFEELVGQTPGFKKILKQVETVAPTDSAVLIRGETGTGKELLARAIHNLSTRKDRALVKVNCAAIPTGLLESELFGHERGAFTGAITQRAGRFELAHNGTLFLDEVGDIPLELQPKLLRVLQEQEFERLGSARTQKVDVRLIAATNSDLEQLVADKRYRADLYYRLNVVPITIPPLRQRSDDIPALARFFTQKYARRLKKRIETIPAEAMATLTGYAWPGNVRELEHFIERAVVLTQGSDLEVSFADLRTSDGATASTKISTLEAAEREHILKALESSDWVVGGPKGAAARLGMKRTTLQSRIQKLGLTRGKT